MRKTGKEVRSEWEKEREKEKAEYGGYDKYEVEEWVSSFEKVAEIMGDSKKMALVSKCLAKKESALSNVVKFMKKDDPKK